MKARLRLIRQRMKTSSIFFLLVGLFILAVCWDRIVILIPPGHGGVMWRLFWGGTDTSEELMGEGMHVILPWDRIYIYDLRLQNHNTSYFAVTQDGLQTKISVSFRWEVNPRKLGAMHRKFGPDYRETLMAPAIGSITRHIVSRYPAEALVSAKRNEIQRQIYLEVTSDQMPNGIGSAKSQSPDNVILMEDILITEVVLPKEIREAIANKLREAQLVQEYAYRVQRERLESERKAEEAEGIRRFQQIVAANLSPAYLRWRGIEATSELARSPNSKVVVVGNAQTGGLPLILDTNGQSGEPSAKPHHAKIAPKPPAERAAGAGAK